LLPKKVVDAPQGGVRVKLGVAVIVGVPVSVGVSVMVGVLVDVLVAVFVAVLVGVLVAAWERPAHIKMNNAATDKMLKARTLLMN
jgi:hypothetical protein